MQTIGYGLCKNCNSSQIEYSEGLSYFESLCPFCGLGYTREVVVDEDYYSSMSKREFPVFKESYEVKESTLYGQGMIFIAIYDESTFSSNFFDKNKEYIEYHKVGTCYGQGFFIPVTPDVNLKNIIAEIESNDEINKELSYITTFDDNRLNLVYGDKIDFLRESNSEVGNLIRDILYPIEKHSFQLRTKSKEDAQRIEKKIHEISRKIERVLTMDIVELNELLNSSPNVFEDEDINLDDLPF